MSYFKKCIFFIAFKTNITQATQLFEYNKYTGVRMDICDWI